MSETGISKMDPNRHQKQLCRDEITELPPKCRERFISLDDPFMQPFAKAGVRFSGFGVESSGYHIKRTAPRWHTIIYTLSGRGRLETGGKTYHLKPGDLYIAPANCPHEYWTDRPSWRMAWFCLDELNGLKFSPKRPLIVRSPYTQLVFSLVGQLLESSKNSGQLQPAIVNHCVQMLLLVLRQDTESIRHSFNQRQRQRIDAAFLAVHRDPAFDWSVAALLKQGHLGLGEDRLRQLCIEFYGESPMARVRAIRMQIAKELLLATDYPLRTIAPMVGYHNEFAFSKAFHRAEGTPPGEFRKPSAQ